MGISSVPFTKNYFRLKDRPKEKDIIVLEGSTRSSKTISICQYIIGYMIDNPGTIVRCYRQDGTTHEDTTIADFRFVMGQFGRSKKGISQYTEDLIEIDKGNQYFEEAGKWNIQRKQYKFNNGSLIRFHETKNIKQKHGLSADISWLNEVMEISHEAWDQIEPRTRHLKILDFNPSFNHHWVFEKIVKQPNCSWHHSTYRDNPFLTDEQIFAIEKHNPDDPENVRNGTADRWWWDVYGLGKRGKVEGVVFKLWDIVPPEQWPDPFACRRHGYALDFGFFPDPAALIEMCLWNQGLYMREIFYENDLIVTPNQTRPDVPSIHQRLVENNISKDARIYADCAEPRTIRELQLMGWNIVPCQKGPDSINHGINLLQGYKMFVHRHSINLQTELEHYTWDKKVVAGETTWLSKPIDKWNHLIDPARYWAMGELNHERRVGQTGRRGGGRARTKR